MSSVSNFNRVVAKCINTSYDFGSYAAERGGRMITPTALSSIGGWICGNVWFIGGSNARLGAVQGIASSALHSFVFRPIAFYLERHKGFKEDEINPNAVDFLYVVGSVASIALPILFTATCGDVVLRGASHLLPESIGWLLAPSGIEDYTKLGGFVSTIAPFIFHASLGVLTKEEMENIQSFKKEIKDVSKKK